METNQIRLDDVLSRDVGVQWFEAVALVRSICQQLGASSISIPEFPAPQQTYLSADGSVSFAAAPGGEGVVAKAANVLAQMLDDDVPVRLRLLVSQATAGDSSYATLAEFAEALAYFERPDSRQILRQLYDRATTAAPRCEPHGRHEPLAAAAAQPAASAPSVRPGRGVSRVAVLVAVAAALLCAIIWSVALVYRDGRMSAAMNHFKATVTASSTGAPGDPVGSTTRSMKARTGTGASARKTGETNRSVRREQAPAPLPLWLPELSPVLRTAPDDGHWLARALDPTAGTTLSREDEGGPDARIYSKEDARVTLPRSIYPHLPADPPDLKIGSDRTMLELIISTDGLVERVRLRTPPRDVHEFMLVSAAKAWVFEPARVDGRPVRFLHRVPITTP